MVEEDAQRFMARYWGEVWRDGNLAVVDELFGERFTQHSARGSITFTTKELKERLVQLQRVLHRPATTIDDFTLDGDKLWVRATSNGVNLETDAASCVSWMSCYRFRDGLVVEAWIAAVPDVDWR